MSTLSVDIIGNARKFNAALDSAAKKSQGFSGVLKGAGIGIGLGMFGALTTAIGGVTQALGDAHTAYQEDIASQGLLKTALQNSVAGFDGQTASIERVIAAQMELGFSDEEQRASLALLVGSTNDVAQAQALQVAAMDLARLKGIDLAAATDIMLKANEGNYKGLKSVGISLDANTTSTEMLAAVTALAGGQAEAYASGPLGKQEAAQLKVGESMERVGMVVSKVAEVVLPIVADAFTTVIDVIGDLWAEIGPLVTQLVTKLTPAFKAIAGFIGTHVVPLLRTLIGTYLKVMITVFGTLADIIGRVSGVVLPILGGAFKVVGTIVGTITKGIGLLGQGAKTLGTIFGTLARNVGNAWNSILGVIKRVINTIIRGWNSLKFTIPSVDLGPLGKIGGFSIGTPNIPLLHKGGIVPGARGQDVLTILQAGEQVTPVKDVGKGGTVHIHFHGPVFGSDSAIDEMTRMIAMRLRTAP